MIILVLTLFVKLSSGLKIYKDSIENLSEKIEACKFLICGQEDRAGVSPIS
ncbi:MAG: hypothetical protein ACR5K2_05135 [Wolbachia sp.]